MNTAAQDYHAFLQGDQDALVRIIDRYKDGLILYLNGIVSNLDVAEDLTEDVFLKLVLKKPRFSAKSSFKTWLYSIGRNLALEDFTVVKSIHVQHGNMSQLNILPNDTSFDPIEEKEQYHQNYHLEGSQLPTQSGKGSIQFAWFPAQKLQYILAHEPTHDLTNIRDNITITVTYTDGTQDIKIIALSADETGDIYATLHGDTMTA